VVSSDSLQRAHKVEVTSTPLLRRLTLVGILSSNTLHPVIRAFGIAFAYYHKLEKTSFVRSLLWLAKHP